MSCLAPPSAHSKEGRQWIGLNEIPDDAHLSIDEEDEVVNTRRWHLLGSRLGSVFQDASTSDEAISDVSSEVSYDGEYQDEMQERPSADEEDEEDRCWHRLGLR